MNLALKRLLAYSLSSILLPLSGTLTAQEFIPVSADEMRELAILFAPAAAVGNADGEQVPATVMSSPDASHTVHSWFEGVLSQWHVSPGDALEAGTAIVTLRSEELLSTQQSLLAALVAQASADANLQRDQNLFDAGVIASARLEETRRQFQQATLSTAAIRQRLLSAGLSATDLDSLSRSQQTTGTYTLRASQSGTLVRRLAQVGDYITDGSAVAAIASEELPWLQARVPAYLAGQLSVGQNMRIAEQNAGLTLRQIDQQIDAQTQTIGVLAQFIDVTEWMPGQILTLILPPANTGIRVPAGAVVFNGSETTVYVRRQGGVEARTVELQPAGRNYLAVSGITAGEEIVTQGAAVLKGIQLGLGGTE